MQDFTGLLPETSSSLLFEEGIWHTTMQNTGLVFVWFLRQGFSV